MVNFLRIAGFFLLLPCVFACTPAFSDRSSAVTGPRVLAVRSEPAEAPPGNDVSYSLLVVDDQGTVNSLRAKWTYCTQPKSTNELNDVATACFGSGVVVEPALDGGTEETSILIPFGSGTSPTAKLPVTGCAQFGPDVPHPAGGSAVDSSGNAVNQTQGRPTDADSTGGYYQPLILQVNADGTQIPTLGETRITCGLAGSTTDQLQDYHSRTKPNENPQLLSVTSPTQADQALIAVDAKAPLAFAASQTFTLRANWAACPSEASCGDGICSPGEAVQDCPDDCTTPKGCGGSEPFAYLDPQSHELVDRHESMRVSWFATSGSFDSDHTGRLESEFAQTTSDNTWTAPKDAGPVFVHVGRAAGRSRRCGLAEFSGRCPMSWIRDGFVGSSAELLPTRHIAVTSVD